MNRTYTIVLTGQWGSGKTVMALSYQRPQGETKRLVIDKEARAIEYNAQALGYKTDKPEALAFAFDMWPDEYGDFNQEQFLEFIRGIEKDTHNVIIIDNFSMLADELSGWMQNANYARQITRELGIYSKFQNFIETRFKVDPSFHNMFREVVRQIILKIKRANKDVIVTAELKNVWVNYGVKGYDSEGKPLQKIVGKTARAPESLFAMADVIWHLSRNREKVTDKPTVQIDPLSPKCSIVGVPATFTFTGWDKIWEASRKRIAADFSGVQMPETEYIAPEEEEDREAQEQRLKNELMRELVEELKLYSGREDIARQLTSLNMKWTLEEHEKVRQALIDARKDGAE